MKRFHWSAILPLLCTLALLGSLAFGAVPTGTLAAAAKPAANPSTPLTGPTVIRTNPSGTAVGLYTTITAAITAAVAGDTVNVWPGTYIEQLDIDKAITLRGSGAGVTIIQSPATLVTKFTTSGPNKPIVYVHNGVNATIQYLTVDGAGLGNSNIRMDGIAFYNAGGTIDHTTITHIRNSPMDGIQAGVGIFGYVDSGTYTLNVDHNTINDYQKNGTVFSGVGLTVNVTNNTVTGSGPVAFIAQNGIQVSFGATGVVSNNMVSNHSYTPFTTVSTGILLYQGDAQALNNTLSENQMGIYHGDSNGTDDGNTISATGAGTGSAGFWGIDVDAPPPGRQPSPFDASGMARSKPASPATVQYNIVTHNTLTSNGSSGGVAIEADGGLGAFDMDFYASDNTITQWNDGVVVWQCVTGCTAHNFTRAVSSHNTLTNNHVGMLVDGNPINVPVHFYNNYLSGNNLFGIQNTNAATTVDGTNNWWGAASGPSGAGGGSGDAVSTNVAYNPWLTGGVYAHLAPSSPITVTNGTTVALDLKINAGAVPVIGQQSYLTFPPTLLQNVNPNTGTPSLTVTHDLTSFTQDIQNQVCNSTGTCTFGFITASPGSIAYASSVAPLTPGITGDFRVAQVSFAANAVGDATVHWQFSPPDPANRNSRINDPTNTVVSNNSFYQDYLIHVVHAVFTGHVTWEGRPAQPHVAQALPLTLTLIGASTYTYNVTTDPYGNFSVTLDNLPNGTYTWRVKGPKYLSTSGTVTLSHAALTPVAMGLQPAGDANNDNLVDITDFGVLYTTFAKQCGDPGYDDRADFSGECVVDTTDFSLLRGNFGRLGNRPGSTAPAKTTSGSATLELRPQGQAPANGGTAHVGDTFVLELWANAAPGTNVAAQQSYLTFPATSLQLGSPAGGATGPARVTPDATVFPTALQNAICNSVETCAFNGLKVPAGSLAFASGTLNATPGTGAFRVGQVTVQATAPGTARLHWQVGPTDPANRNSKVVTDGASTASQAAAFADYVLTVLPAGK